jgi:hypothetical protein
VTAQFAFDTLAFVKRLSLAEALTAHAFGELATKDDIKDLELRLTIRMGALAAATVAILGALITFS